jgi:hypothetical protein
MAIIIKDECKRTRVQKFKISFLVDSGASCHITNLPYALLHEFIKQESTALTADKGDVVRCSGFCDLKGFVKDTDGNTTCIVMVLKDVVVAPTFEHTLISVSKLADTTGVSCSFTNQEDTSNFLDVPSVCLLVLMACVIYISM